MIELAEKLIGIAPAPLAKAFFVNSGSEAIDSAIKLIWYYKNARGLPEKKKLIARQRAYHGITIAAGHLTGAGLHPRRLRPADDATASATSPRHRSTATACRARPRTQFVDRLGRGARGR